MRPAFERVAKGMFFSPSNSARFCSNCMTFFYVKGKGQWLYKRVFLTMEKELHDQGYKVQVQTAIYYWLQIACKSVTQLGFAKINPEFSAIKA